MAIDDLLDEHEQSRQVQDWLRRNGPGLLGGILLGLAAVAGWKWWERRQVAEAMGGADRYQVAVDAIERGGAGATSALSTVPPGMYRTLAAQQLARSQVDAGQAAAAIATLRGNLPQDPTLRQVVQQRIARLLLETGKPADALREVQGDSPEAHHVRGDVQFALGRRDDARESYRKALAGTDVAAPQRGLIELKYTQVGGVPAKPQTP